MSNTPTTYPEFVASRTKTLDHGGTYDMLHMAVGISGEAGELLDAIKKVWIYEKAPDQVNIAEELGDLLFYIQGFANIYGWTVEELMTLNRAKLEKRYPSGYSNEAAQERADKVEESNTMSDIIKQDPIKLNKAVKLLGDSYDNWQKQKEDKA